MLAERSVGLPAAKQLHELVGAHARCGSPAHGPYEPTPAALAAFDPDDPQRVALLADVVAFMEVMLLAQPRREIVTCPLLLSFILASGGHA